jgi:hypothetical protein
VNSRSLAPFALWAALLAGALPLAAGSRVPPVASYRISASWDEATKKLTADETVTFVNRTSHTFREIELHLYLNAFRNERSTFRRNDRMEKHRDDPAWFGTIEVNRIALADGTDLTASLAFVSPDDGNPDDRTVARIPLPRPVPPGATLVFHVDFVSKFPRNTVRTGVWGDFLLAGQWFPKLGKATESGWLTHQFHESTEFFADFGDYDVSLELPASMKGKVGASGVEKETTELAGGRIRTRFVAEDVHDFAWTCSPRFEVHRAAFSHAGLPNVTLVLFLQPEHRGVKERYFQATRDALSRYGTWFVPYPYPVVTIVDPPFGSGGGGMEYPTFFTGGASWIAPRSLPNPEGVTVHEFGHQVFYGLLASNETDEAHLDEGLNTWATARVLKETWGNMPLEWKLMGVTLPFPWLKVPPEGEASDYLDAQAAGLTDSMSVPTFRQLGWDSVKLNVYARTQLALESAARTVGNDSWMRIMKSYATKWAFRHPSTPDFLREVESASPEVAAALGRSWQGAPTYDYAVTSATARKLDGPAGYTGSGASTKFVPPKDEKDLPKPVLWESEAVVRRLGDGVWPVIVELRFEGKHVIRRSWDGSDRWIRFRATGAKLVSATVDPDRNLVLDVNVLNNGRLVEPDPEAAGWLAHRLRFWSQNLLELFALVAVTAGGLP